MQILELFENIGKQYGANDTMATVIPVFLAFHLLFWISKFVSPWLFSTYNTLSEPMKDYWAASMVSTIHSILIVPLALKAALDIDMFVNSVYETSPASTFVK